MAYHHSNNNNSAIGDRSIRSNGDEYSADEHESRSGGEERATIDFNDKPIYLLEHLATFTVNKESGILYPADGMRRLLQLEKTTGIWSQKMQLCLDHQWLLIMDYETGNIIERFPASLIQEPTAFTSTDAMELYNNILVFIVSGDSVSRSEMHIFQSQNVSAVHLVEDLKNLRSGKITQQREHIPIYSSDIPLCNQNMPKPITHDQQQYHNRNNVPQYRDTEISNGVIGETDSEIGGINDETSSTSSDKYERDVTVLNHCFDDIEKFIARLQHAAAATRELERRQRNRKTKKKDLGEGLLTLRTRPPHEKEFIDIFAKFKLSFDLLAKLKAHIHDPNAPELVHFLFTPLALIVEAASDSYYDSHLPAHVINPLLTREAINLLINCVTSKETELWRSLGDAWIIPRDQWKEEVPAYHPVFLDGWSPDYVVIDELEPAASTSLASNRRTETQHHLSGLNRRQVNISFSNNATVSGGGGSRTASNIYDEYDGNNIMLSDKYTMHNQQTSMEGGTSAVDFGTRSEISNDSIEISSINPNSIEMNSGNTAVNSHAQNDMLLQSITTGLHNLNSSGGDNGACVEPLEPLQSQRTNISGTSIMNSAKPNITSSKEVTENRLLEDWIDDLQSTGAKIVLVTYPRTANNDKELSVERGEYLEILDDTRKWWKARNIHGQVAHVPHTIVTAYNYNNVPNHKHAYEQKQHSKIYKGHPYVNATPITTQEASEQHSAESALWIRNKHLGKKGEFRYF